MRVLAIGESLIELQSAGSRQLDWTFAGDALNCAAAVAHANPSASVQHLTGVGDDSLSAELVSFCERLGVDAAISPVVPGKTLGLYWITADDGDRRFTYWRSDSAARAFLQSGSVVLPEPMPELIIFSGITLAVAGSRAPELLKTLTRARATGAQIAFDTNHRPSLWPDVRLASERTEHALDIADFVHTSTDDVAALCNEDVDAARRWSQQFGIEEVLLTDGAGPVSIFSHTAETLVSPVVAPVIDSAGAGDAFFGTYLGHRLNGLGAEQAAARALEVGAAVVQCPGALGYLLGGDTSG